MPFEMEPWEVKVELARAVKYHLFQGDKRKPCMWCGNVLEFDSATIEHLTPHSHGGPLSVSNAGLACSPCNQKRGTLPIEDFHASAWLLEKRRQVQAQKNNRRIPQHPDGEEFSDDEVRLAAYLYLNLLDKNELIATISGMAKQGHLDKWASHWQELNS